MMSHLDKFNEYLISIEDVKGLEDYPTKKILADLQREKKHSQYDKKIKYLKNQNPFDMEEEKDHAIKYRLSQVHEFQRKTSKIDLESLSRCASPE